MATKKGGEVMKFPAFDAMWYALCFYADPSRYQGANSRKLPGDPYTPPDQPYRQDVLRDCGAIAREAIESDGPTMARQVHQVVRMSALVELMQEATKDKNTRTAYIRTQRALKVLGFTPDEGVTALKYLQYLDNNGKPWPWLTEKTTKGKSK